MFTKILELLKVVFKFPSYGTIHDLFDKLSKVSLKMFYTSISIITFYIFISSLLTSQFSMKPFSIPDGFSADGYSGEILSREIMDRFNQITRETIEMKNEDKEDEGNGEETSPNVAKKDTTAAKNKFISDINAINFSNGLENLDVEVLGLGLSVGKLSEYIRILLGVEVKKITGELIKKDNTLVLNMRLTGYPPLSFVTSKEGSDYEKIKSLEEKAALALKKFFSPLELAFYLYKKEQYEEAIEAAEYAIEDENVRNKHWAHYIIAQAEIEDEEHYEHGYEYFGKATEEFSGFVEAWYNWGYYLYKEGRYKESIEKFEEVVKYDEKHKHALVYWGNCLFSLNQFEKAIEKHKEAIKHNSLNYYVMYALGFDLMYMGRYEEAIPYYIKAIELYPENTNNHLELAECYFYTGDTTLALDTYVDGKNAVTSYREQQELYKKWAAFSLLVGREQEAISIMSQHLIWEEEYEDYTTDKILFKTYVQLDWEEFSNQKIDYYKNMIISDDYKSYHYSNLAYLFSKIGEYDSAIHYYKQYLKIYIEDPDDYKDIADVYASKGDFEQAKLYYKKNIDKGEPYTSLLVSWGLVLLRNKEYEAALKMFQEARDISVGTRSSVYHGLALANEALGKDQLALSYYYQGLDKGEDPLMLMEYSELLKKTGRDQDSEEIVQLLFSNDEFDSRSAARSIYNKRGLKVAIKYYNMLIEIAEKKGKFYTLLAYVHALDKNEDAFFENMQKAKDEGFPIKGLMRYFPYNKEEYADGIAVLIK